AGLAATQKSDGAIRDLTMTMALVGLEITAPPPAHAEPTSPESRSPRSASGRLIHSEKTERA
ncbi:MAG TPA: hypothetical protein VIR00_12355, partial [Micromonosporaceae bacterium]